ncbi:hypothetical protein GYMLUDRAFT_72060 [Collybiopsis luxurians FD-317 M1]|uniref:Unplaced genomic scaffold GYMLUscaffold_16, whole genome shotgun sequence n=1 Tax=Collybiopsis luxurians FD-317 M1 TaxID=944289 RepID=A0A0D0D2A0_9AGAR|nr:hypothetical protein GYMLUDRAFT_72060 [Collybiopsis luxurians FD-317 M1]
MSNNASGDVAEESSSLIPGSLYALLSYRGELGAWEWSFLFPNPAVEPVGKEGTLFYVKIMTSNNTKPYWKFSMDTVDILSSPEAVALVKLSDIADLGSYNDIVSENGLCPMFKVVEIPAAGLIPKDFSSRSWFLDVMGSLADCGVCQCDDVWLLEREIRRYAFSAMDKYMQNRGYTVFVAEKSS